MTSTQACTLTLSSRDWHSQTSSDPVSIKIRRATSTERSAEATRRVATAFSFERTEDRDFLSTLFRSASAECAGFTLRDSAHSKSFHILFPNGGAMFHDDTLQPNVIELSEELASLRIKHNDYTFPAGVPKSSTLRLSKLSHLPVLVSFARSRFDQLKTHSFIGGSGSQEMYKGSHVWTVLRK